MGLPSSAPSLFSIFPPSPPKKKTRNGKPFQKTLRFINDQKIFKELILLQSSEKAEALSKIILQKMTSKTVNIYEAQLELIKRSSVFKLEHVKFYLQLLKLIDKPEEKCNIILEMTFYRLNHGMNQEAYEHLTGQLNLAPFINDFRCHRLAARISHALADGVTNPFLYKKWLKRTKMHYKDALALNNSEMSQEYENFTIEYEDHIDDNDNE